MGKKTLEISFLNFLLNFKNEGFTVFKTIKLPFFRHKIYIYMNMIPYKNHKVRFKSSGLKTSILKSVNFFFEKNRNGF